MNNRLDDVDLNKTKGIKDYTFNVIKQNKPVLHRIESKLFVVTSVDDCMTAPVQRGFKLIGIRMM